MLRALVLLLTVLTGFSGLVYEVAWQKSFAILLGSHSEATAAVLGIFLGGLSLGYSVFGGVCRRLVQRAERAGRPPRLLLTYAVVEAGIGVWALAFPALFAGVRDLSVSLHVAGELGFAVDVVLTALLIGPPTVLMGGTIPILTQALARDLTDATRFHALVYGFNTVGAFAGAVAAGFFLIPLLGIPGTLWLMGGINLLAGAAFGAIAVLRRDFETSPTASAPAPSGPKPEVEGSALYAAAACLLGFAMMSTQTAMIRLSGLSFGASHFTFAMVVAVFVLAIALGSLAVSLFERIPRAAVVGCPLALAAYLAGLYPFLDEAPYAAHVLRSLFRDVEEAFYPYYLTGFAAILVVLIVPAGLAGASLPLLFHALRRQVGELGSVAGRLYSWNTIGNLLGALLGGYALLVWLDLHQIYRIAVGAAAGAGALLAFRLYRPRLAPLALGCALGLGGLIALPPWSTTLVSGGLFRIRAPTPLTYAGPDAVERQLPGEVDFYDDDPTTTVAVRVLSGPEGQPSPAIMTNGKPDGSLIHDYPTMGLAGILPCLVADACQDAFVIGWGTGVTVGELAALDEMRQVVVAEISSGVLEAARFFEHGNQGASGNPKVRILRSDAYRALLRSEGRFDVIVSEPSNPWVTGVEMLFSREFLEAARDRLRPGGVYTQWLQTYEIDKQTLELVLRTYTGVFDAVSVWFTLGPDMLLLGIQDPEALTLDRIEARAGRPDFAAGLRRVGIETLPALLAHEILPLGVVHAIETSGPVHTLLHPLLSHRAARAFFVGQQADLPSGASPRAAEIGSRNSLLRAWEARHGPVSEPLRARIAREVCSARGPQCATLLAVWMHEDPDSEALQQVIAEARADSGVAPHVQPGMLQRLVDLYAVPDAKGGTLPPAVATARSQLFALYYHHAFPFPRETLRHTWRRCLGDGCRAAREEAEALVGPIFGSSERRSTARGEPPRREGARTAGFR